MDTSLGLGPMMPEMLSPPTAGAGHHGAAAVHSNLYVRNLPAEFDQTTVECMFRKFGAIVGCRFFKGAAIPYAFIKLESVDEAQNAVDGLNGTTIMNRQLLVKFADADATYDLPNENLYVRNLPAPWNEEDIRTFFSQYGTITSVRLLPMTAHATAQAAMVRFSGVEEAVNAKNANNAVVPPGHLMALNVKYADTPEEKARKAQKAGRPLFTGGNSNSRYAPYPLAATGSGATTSMPLMGGAVVAAPYGLLGTGSGMNGGGDALAAAGSQAPPWQQAAQQQQQQQQAFAQGMAAALPPDMLHLQQQQQLMQQQLMQQQLMQQQPAMPIYILQPPPQQPASSSGYLQAAYTMPYQQQPPQQQQPQQQQQQPQQQQQQPAAFGQDPYASSYPQGAYQYPGAAGGAPFPQQQPPLPQAQQQQQQQVPAANGYAQYAAAEPYAQQQAAAYAQAASGAAPVQQQYQQQQQQQPYGAPVDPYGQGLHQPGGPGGPASPAAPYLPPQGPAQYPGSATSSYYQYPYGAAAAAPAPAPGAYPGAAAAGQPQQPAMPPAGAADSAHQYPPPLPGGGSGSAQQPAPLPTQDPSRRPSASGAAPPIGSQPSPSPSGPAAATGPPAGNASSSPHVVKPGTAEHGGMAGASASSLVSVHNLPPHADRLLVYERFAPFGGVLSVALQGNGKAAVQYADAASAARAAMNMNGTAVGESLVRVNLA